MSPVNRPDPPHKLTVFGQPSWRLATRTVETFLTETGGHLGPVYFLYGDHVLKPFAVCPWAEEEFPEDLPPMLRVLRGDFFCMPFGANTVPFRDEHHPPHGETSNSVWTFDSIHQGIGVSTWRFHLDTTVRTGRIDKYITLREDHHAIYIRHQVSGVDGPMNLGHHAMLKFPDEPASGIIATSPFAYAQTAPLPLESPDSGGQSFLAPNASFRSIRRVPTVEGSRTDISRYPARLGYEDLVLMIADPTQDFAWTAVTFADQQYVWFALKDPRILKHTIFWISNGGRPYPPWNGRHSGVMGLEEVTSYFHYGLAESAEANPLNSKGFDTCLQLDSSAPLDVRYIMGVAKVPEGFDGVETITADPDLEEIHIQCANGLATAVPLDVAFLQATKD